MLISTADEAIDWSYDDMESGKVTPIDGGDAYWQLMAMTEAERQLLRFRALPS